MCGVNFLMSVLSFICVKNNGSHLVPVVVKFQTLNLYLFFFFSRVEQIASLTYE